MFRFTIRDVLWLTVVVGLSIALVVEHTWKSYTYHKVQQQSSDEYQALLDTRFEAVKSEFHHRMLYWRGPHSGRMSLPDTCDTIERFIDAACEAIESPAERIKQCEVALDAARYLEQMTQSKYEDDVEPLQVLERVRYTRYDVESKLNLAQREANAKQANR